eukprot:GFYU01065371.1.p2 GENE.GFYU01065371.1~~GFYU01065371.1.p2  ORF type:complete len:104 (-),score=8.94 GFYU01065371.1:214-501(-)
MKSKVVMKRKLRIVAVRMRERHKLAAFNGFVHAARMIIHRKRVVRRSLARIAKAREFKVFTAWSGFTTNQRRNAKIIHRAAAKWHRRGLSTSFEG